VPGAVGGKADLAADDRLDPVRRDDEVRFDRIIDDDAVSNWADATDVALLEPGASR
jgi:hypothetical protein